jgi:hypothetical protein
MADEIFALSPISARATLPSEEDYEAIREAFMETSRGRWFLGEYAKRNRNADTRLVLDAVTRIEDTLAAQKQPPPPPPPPDTGLADALLADALAAIRSALGEARLAASSAVESLDPEQHLATVRKGTRVIREISWRLREIGADGRICDLIDSQLNAIETACGQLTSADPKTALGTAFDLIEGRIGTFEKVETAVPIPPPAAAKAAPSPKRKGASKATMNPSAKPAESIDETVNVAAQAVEATVKTVNATTQAVNVVVEVVDVTPESGAPTTTEAEVASDEAVLDLVAREMAAAPDDLDALPEIDVVESPAAVPEPADLEVTAAQPQPVAEPQSAAAPSSRKRSPRPKPEAAVKPSDELRPSREPAPAPTAVLEPSPEPSLGSTLLATGIVKKPSASASDPLAPIRRMSQAEKIAFFS